MVLIGLVPGEGDSRCEALHVPEGQAEDHGQEADGYELLWGVDRLPPPPGSPEFARRPTLIDQ